MRVALAVSFIAGLTIAGPANADSVSNGRDLAQRWCSSCHVVGPDMKGADTAPPFTVIARKNATNPAWVRSWLATTHPKMPSFDLAREQVDDIVAYLGSLPQK
jgi:mono/diheme cytochrome c family protein